MKIIRRNKSIRFYKQQSKYYPNLTATGIEAEFYDQSHFIKDFKLITGITPGQYFRENNIFNLFVISSIDKKRTSEKENTKILKIPLVLD
jgi:AraC-like DNA-binding protein